MEVGPEGTGYCCRKTGTGSPGLSCVPLLGRRELGPQEEEESAKPRPPFPKPRAPSFTSSFLSPPQRSLARSPRGRWKLRLLCVLCPGVPELQQRLLPEDARGQGQLGAVLRDQPGSLPHPPSFPSSSEPPEVADCETQKPSQSTPVKGRFLKRSWMRS